MNRDEESILAREAQLIFSNVNGFNMGDSLRVWRGKVKAGSPNNKEYEIEFILPNGFPQEKPILKAISTIFHPNVSHDGYLNLDILEKRLSVKENSPTLLAFGVSIICFKIV